MTVRRSNGPPGYKMYKNIEKNHRPPQNFTTKAIGDITRTCQVTIEVISQAKCKHLSKILRDHQVDIALIQESHLEDENQVLTRARIHGPHSKNPDNTCVSNLPTPNNLSWRLQQSSR